MQRADDTRLDRKKRRQRRIQELVATGIYVEWDPQFWPWALLGLARRSRIFSAVVIFSVCALSALPVSAQTYTVTNLGTLGGSSAYPFAVNNAGQVVGHSQTLGGSNQAFLWTQEGGMVDLGTLGGNYSYARGINNAGQVVGYSYNAGGFMHAFLWTPEGGMVDLGTLGGNYSYARGINNAGQVVGYSETANKAEHAFLWTPEGGMVDLGTLGGNYSYAHGINNAGQVVGYSETAGNASIHAFLWTPEGGMVDLGTLGGIVSSATGINDAGQVVGHSQTAGNAYYHAFLWTQGGGMVDLGTLGGIQSGARGINNAGQVVGSYYTASTRAFLWTQGAGMVDLGTLGGDYSYAEAINDAGQVVGDSFTAGNASSRPFLWTQGGGMVDLNELIPTPSVGRWLEWAGGISNTGFIIARSHLGEAVVLSLDSSAPVLGPIYANDPVAVASPVSVSACFKDTDEGQTYAAEWTWGDGTADSIGTVSQTGDSWTTEGSHVYSEAGIYTVSLKITDSSGLTAEVSRDVVVFDPSAGFVTGTGWIVSPPGALEQDQALAGRATFEFVLKYLKGANKPTGKTEFQFHAANLSFHGGDCEWLVVSGSRAQCKGTGTLNGTGSYRFLLTAVDGDQEGNTRADRFRIQIWYYDSDLNEDVVVYDNQLDSSTVGTSQEGTRLGGGSIVIHR